MAHPRGESWNVVSKGAGSETSAVCDDLAPSEDGELSLNDLREIEQLLVTMSGSDTGVEPDGDEDLWEREILAM